MASDNTIEITIKAVDEASATFDQIKQEGAEVATELQKRLGTFIAPDQAKQLGEAIAAATATGGKNIDDATQQAIRVLAGLSNQIKETNTQIEAGTPIQQRAAALLEAFGVKATTASAAISKNGDEAIKAAADQEKLAASIAKSNVELGKQEKFGVQEFVGPPLPDELRRTSGLLPSTGKLGSNAVPRPEGFAFDEELAKQRFAATFVGPLPEQPAVNPAATAETVKLTAAEQELADATKKAFAEQTALSESFTKVGQAAGLSGNALDQFVAANIASANASKNAAEATAKVGEGAEKSKESMSGLALGVIAVNQALELMEKVVGPLVHALEHVSEDAGKFEQQVVGLESTLRVFHKTASADSLIEFSDEMRKTSAVSRELVLDVEQTLTKFSDLGRGADASGEQLKKMTAIVIGLAQAENLPPSSVARQLANFLTNPQATNIGRGVNLPNVALDERPAEVIKRLGGNVDIANDQLNTFIGSQRKLAAATEQIGHIIGEQMNVPLKAMNEVLADSVEWLGKFLKEHDDLAAGLAISGNAIRGTLDVLGKLAPILSAIALISMSPLVATLGTLSVALAAFAVTPPGLVLMGIAFAGLAAAGIAVGVNMLHAADAAKSAGQIIAETNTRLENLKKQRASTASETLGKELDASIAKAEAELVALRKQAESQFKPVAEGQTFSTFPSAGGSEDPGTLRAQAIERATKEIQEASKDQAQALIATQTEVKAEGEKLLFSATNNIEHLVNAIDLGRLAIIQKTNAEINTKLRALAKKELGGTATVEDLRKEAPDLVATVEGDARKKQAQELQKFDQTNVQTLRQAREAAAKANIDLLSATATVQQSLIDNDQAQLKILQDLNAPLEQQLALIKSIGVVQIAQAEDRIKIAQQGIRDLQARPDAGSAANLAQQELLTAEIQKQRTLQLQAPLTTLKSTADLQSAAVKRVTTEIQSQQTELGSIRDSEQRRLDLVNAQAQAEGRQSAPYAQLLSIAEDLDKLEAQILEKRIAQQKVEAANVQTRAALGLVSQAEADLATKQLEATERLAENVKTHVLDLNQKITQDAKATADALAGTIADNFVQGLEQGLQGGKKGFLKFLDNAVIALGKAALGDLLKAGLGKVLEPLTTDLAKAGEKPTTVSGGLIAIAKTGLAETELGQQFGLKSVQQKKPFEGLGDRKGLSDEVTQADLLAIGESKKAGLTDANTALLNAGTGLKQAAIDLSNAAAKLAGAPSTGTTTTANAGAAPTSASPPTGNAPTTLTAEQLGDLIDQQIGQRNEIQRIVPQNPQEAAQQAEQLRVSNSQLQATIELRSAVVGAIGKPQTVKLEEPKIAERDITGQTTAIQPVKIEGPVQLAGPENAGPLDVNVEQISGTAAATLEGVNPAQQNVQLGPTTAIADAIDNLGGDKSVNASNVSSLSLPSSVENNIGGATTSSVGDASFASLQGLLGTASGLAGGQNAAAFGKVGGGIGAAKNLFDLYGLLDKAGLFGGGNSAGIFGQFPAASGLGAGADLSGYSFSALGEAGAGSGGLFSSIGSGVSTALDFITSFFSAAHEGGPIDKYKRMHTGGPADDVPIMAQHGEYILQRSSAASIGKSTLDKINTTGRLPRTMHAGGEVQYFAEGGQVSMSPWVPTSHISPSASGMAVPKATMGKIGLGGGGRDASLKPGQETPGQNRTGITSGRDDVAPAPIHQNIYVVDQRPKSLSTNDVIAAIENDMVAGNGRTARAVQNVIKRTR